MHAHDVPDFPEPVLLVGGRHVLVPVHVLGAQLGSPQVRAADAACKKYTPGGVGLPFLASKEVAHPEVVTGTP